MDLRCDTTVARHLQSRAQQVRVATEQWFGAQGYCLACPSPRLRGARANSIAKDFVCPLCNQSYELKSSRTLVKRRVVDGAYATMLERISSRDAPSLILLRYLCEPVDSSRWVIERVVAIDPVFLTSAVVEPRKPLSLTARRAGWQGCNLRIDRIPPEGHIPLIKEGKAVDPAIVRQEYRSSNKLAELDPNARGWTMLVLNIIRRLGTEKFGLNEVYARKQSLEEAYPNNRNIEAKIRQQLQVLRDLGYLRFSGRGTYVLER